MNTKPRILYVAGSEQSPNLLPDSLQESVDVVRVQNPLRALVKVTREHFDGIFVAAERVSEALRLGRLLENDRILEGMPDAVALLDADSTILWANERLRHWANRGNIVGESFFSALGNPSIIGSENSPFRAALRLNHPVSSLMRTVDNRCFHLHAAPVTDPQDGAQHLVVTVRDVTHETLQQQKLVAIQDAGRELSDLCPDDVVAMSVEERVELLKSNILHYTKDLLKFDVVEIRLLNPKTKELLPLLEVGMDPEAARRVLFAEKKDNGVTGFVAATGASYLCEDTTNDKMYLFGVQGAKSSLTVPLKWHQEVIGTFNVESPQPRGFTNADLQFLETFCRDVAGSLNTLQLLKVQRAGAAQEICAAINSEVSLPIDEILRDVTAIAQQNFGGDGATRERLRDIVRKTRGIKDAIWRIRDKLVGGDAGVAQVCADRPKLQGRRVLVVDGEASIRTSAHSMLERYGCVVETAQKGSEAAALYQHSLPEARYDVVLTGVKLPDMSGYDLMIKLKAMIDPVPLILMSEFGWDSGHTLCKAREAGLHSRGSIIKPFVLKQLLDTVETIIDWSKSVEAQA